VRRALAERKAVNKTGPIHRGKKRQEKRLGTGKIQTKRKERGGNRRGDIKGMRNQDMKRIGNKTKKKNC